MPAKVGVFAGPNAVTTQTITGLGFVPGIEIIATAAQPFTLLNNNQGDVNFGLGAAISAGDQVTATLFSNSTVPTQTAALFKSNNFMSTVAQNGSVTDYFDLAGQGGDDFTVDWTTAQTFWTPYLALPNNCTYDVGFFDLTTTPGTQDITTPGFQPGLVILFTSIANTSEGGTQDGYWSMGAGDATGNVWSMACRMRDAVNPSDSASYFTSSNVFTQISTAAVVAQCSTVTMLSNGFRLTKTTVPGTAVRIGYICLGGPTFQAVVNTIQQSTVAGLVQYTFPGFEPDALIFANTQASMAQRGTVLQGVALGLGFGDLDSNNTNLNVTSIDNMPNVLGSQSLRYTWDERIFHIRDWTTLIGSTATYGAANIDSIDPTGFTLDWTVVSSLTTAIGVIAMSTENALEAAELTLAGATDVTLTTQGGAVVELPVSTDLILFTGGDVGIDITIGTGEITPGELLLEGATDIAFDQTFNVTLAILPAALNLIGSEIVGLNCQCLDIPASYEFGHGTQTIDLITEAFERAGIDGTEISGTNLDSARRSLEYMWSEWSNNGPNLWLTELYTITMTAGTSSFALPENTIYIVNAATRQTIGSTVTDLVIGPISRAEYLALPLKAQASNRPTQFYFERTLNSRIYPWPLLQPGQECTLLLYLMRISSDITKFCNAIDAPQRAMDAVAAGLAARLALKYNKPEFDRLKVEATEAYRLMIGEDRERVPYRITIDNPWGP